MKAAKIDLAPAWIITGIGLGLQAVLWVLTWLTKESRDPNIGLGILMMLGIGITLFGLVVFMVVLQRLKKLIPLAVAVLYVLGLWLLWLAGEERSNAIYRAEQNLRTTQSFEGKVTATNYSCSTDAGYCTLTVAGKEVITGCGLTLSYDNCPPEELPVDPMIEFIDGEQVKVTAMKTSMRDNLYTLNCDGCSIAAK